MQQLPEAEVVRVTTSSHMLNTSEFPGKRYQGKTKLIVVCGLRELGL